ncbi:MAG: hypothetical protein ACTSPB_03540 [Candidatus Thorarchaeota archaeon]
MEYAVCRKCGYRISVRELAWLAIAELVGIEIPPSVKYCLNEEDEWEEEHDYVYEEVDE